MPKQLPPKTKARLVSIIQQRDKAQAVVAGLNTAIEEVVATARELMDIPDDWTLTDVDRGFVPPPGDIAETGDPNHE